MKPIIRIAIADDHKLVRAGIVMILKEDPNFLVVQQAANGQELLDRLSETRPNVVLLDLEMPVLSGRETLLQIRESYPETKVLILTMHHNEAFIVQMMNLGANGYLLKDANPDEVLHAIRKVSESSYYFSDKVSLAMLRGISNDEIRLANQSLGHGLSKREIEVLRLICKEHTTTEIGEILFLSPKTIEGYRKTLMDKTGAKNMAGLVMFAVKYQLI
jgi:DNA-binding NarL/FixJ family response regulator